MDNKPSRLRCLVCNAESSSFFQVARVDANGVAHNTGLIHACSLVCLGKWLYTYGLGRGISGMSVLQGVWQGLRGVKPTGSPKR